MNDITKQEINGISTSIERVAGNVSDVASTIRAYGDLLYDQTQQLIMNFVIMNVLLGGLLVTGIAGLILFWKRNRK
jgi:hypothetical protein